MGKVQNGTPRKKIILLRPRGFCAGVVRAIDVVKIVLNLYGAPVYVRKEIVHNRHVVDELRQAGAIFVDELSEVPEGARVIFSAHGVSPAVRDEAKQQQYEYTEFSMLPSIDGCRLIVAVRSAEARTQRFDLEVTIDGHQLAAFRSLAMAPGDVWTREVPVPLLADPQKAEARLYRLEDERLYRQVTALVPGS